MAGVLRVSGEEFLHFYHIVPLFGQPVSEL
jgi:hypothetical protein